jgi:hypothetical protein
MAMNNPFTNPAFTATSLTDAINLIPNRYGRLNQLGLFPVRGVATTTVTVEEQNGILTLLPTRERGAPSTLSDRAKRKRRTFEIPHIPHDDHVSPTDIQNLIAFASENQLATMSAWLNDRLAEMRIKHDQTLEWHRMGALKGEVLDADGSTSLFNWFTEFGVTEVTSFTNPIANLGKKLKIDFKLGTTSTKVVQKIMDVKRHIEANLQGEIMRGIRVLVDRSFFDKLITHANVEKIYQSWQAAQDRMGGDNRSGFTLGGVTFEEYLATSTGSDGSAKPYIATDEGHAFPEGTTQTFRTYVGPADFNESVNQLGRQFYSKVQEAKFGRGWDIHTQQNPLCICLRPSVLVHVHTSD